jgi:integrase/recombinase XerD
MSALASRVDDYLALRRAAGYRLDAHGRLLPQFVSYLDAVGASTVTVEAALAWAMSSTNAGQPQARIRLSIVRGFARYLQAFDPAAQVPPTNLLPDLRRRAAPYLYSEPEIMALLAATTGLRPALRAATYHTLFGLVAVTGIRGGEALKLERDDVDLDVGLLTIRNSKFNKSRRLALHPSTVTALLDYERVRAKLCPQPQTPTFFVSPSGTSVSPNGMRTVFRQLVNDVGLQPRSGSRPPRIHDLRHSFAVTTLTEWYRDGVDVAARMPLLSAYLGHSKPASTYWYLQAAPELLGLAAGRLESPPRARR